MFSDKWITVLAERVVGILNPNLHPGADTEESGDLLDHQASLKRRSETVAAVLEALAWTPEDASRTSR